MCGATSSRTSTRWSPRTRLLGRTPTRAPTTCPRTSRPPSSAPRCRSRSPAAASRSGLAGHLPVRAPRPAVRLPPAGDGLGEEGSAALPDRRALLRAGGGALAGRPRQPNTGSEIPPGAATPRPRSSRPAPAGSACSRRARAAVERRRPPRRAAGDRHRLARRGQAVDEADLGAALGADRVAREGHLHRQVVGHALRQPQQRAAGGDEPALASGMPSLAPRAATIRSQASATSSPPATAKPSIAAMIGLRGGPSTMPAKPRPSTCGLSPWTNAFRSHAGAEAAAGPVRIPTCRSSSHRGARARRRRRRPARR